MYKGASPPALALLAPGSVQQRTDGSSCSRDSTPGSWAPFLPPTLMWITCTSHTVAEPPGPGVEAPVSGTRKNDRFLSFRLSSLGRYRGFSTSPALASLSPRLSASSVACMCACVCCARIACIACTFCPPGRPLAAARWASRHQHEAGQAGRAGRSVLSKQSTEG